jgi:glutamyl-tRNA(Gln) amidotransferase subunit E
MGGAEMEATDWQAMGLKCGIEIHQQLDTAKLFCGCASGLSGKHTHEIERKLRAVAGELGAIDAAALHEAMKGAAFRYRVYPEESCLVEMDEEPPGQLNPEAMDTALMMAIMLQCEIPDEVQVMRKQVIDGSNTTGFQRTAIVGMDGSLGTPLGEVGIANVSVEEEASQIIERSQGSVTYGLNRLSIPLVEIGTAPDIRSPDQAREVAERIGMLLRSTGRVRRGIGTIRQDINVSISGGARVEIKGAQELRLVPKLVSNEASRQSRLLELREAMARKKVRVSSPKTREVTDIFRDSDSGITKGRTIFAAAFPGFRGFLKERLTPTLTLGSEIAGYVRARIGAKGFIHNDEDLGRYGFARHFEELEKRLGASPGDTIIMVAGDEGLASRTLAAIAERIGSFMQGVPGETRKALDNGDTEYLRPLPGSARMYPETDVPPIPVPLSRLSRLRKSLPEAMDDAMRRMVKAYGLSRDMAGQIVRSGRAAIFERAVKAGTDPRLAAAVLTSMMTSLRREGVPVDGLTEARLEEIFAYTRKAGPPKEKVAELLRRKAETPEKAVEGLAGDGSGLDEERLLSVVRDVIGSHRDVLKRQNPEKALMGLAMKELGGKASGKRVMEVLMKELKRKR